MLEMASNHTLKRKMKQLCLLSPRVRQASSRRKIYYPNPKFPVTNVKMTATDDKLVKRPIAPIIDVPSISPECDAEKKTASDRNFRLNEFNIQMLSDSLHKQIFSPENRKNDRRLINAAMDELRKHNLPGVLQKMPDIDLQLPEILNHDLEQHFYELGRQQSEPYRLLIDQLIRPIPQSPKEWVFTPGWMKYVAGQEPVAVPYPQEEALVFDVEVCCKEGDNPVLATAVSETSWYCWVSEDLYNGSKKMRKNDFYHYTTEELVNIESPAKKNAPVASSWLRKPKIIVGHHVSFDRSRIKEQYWLDRTGLRFLDTMSLHIAIRGVTSHQKAMLKSGSAQEESWVSFASVNNSLNEVHKYYCGEELKKETRDIFVNGELQDIRDDFQNLVTYCAMDVVATQKVLTHVWPTFLERFPHPVTLAGVLEQTMAYLPVNGNWKRYLKDSQQTFDDIECESKFELAQLANKNCQLVNNDRYKNSIWLWDQEWGSKNLKLKKVKPLTKKQLKEKSMTKKANANEKPREIEADYESDEFDCNKIRQYENYFTELAQSENRLPKRYVHLIGYPEWYRQLCKPPITDHWIPGPVSISTSVKSVPKLLSLTWNFMPLHRLMKYGWCYVVPFKTDIELPEEERAIFPYREFFQHYLKIAQNGTIAFDGVDCAQIEAYLQHCASRPHESVNPENFGLQCGLVKLPHKNGAQLNVGNPLSRDFINKFSNQEISCNNKITQRVIEMSRQMSYWKNNRNRIESQLVVWLANRELPHSLQDIQVGVIVPQVIPCGTLTRRAVESLWMTASNADHEKIGSELRSMIQAPPGYSLVGADVDSQELWIAGLIGDAHVVKEHGCTPFGWRTLSGQKSEGTDMHSVTAETMGISRHNAKVINYARIYGAGMSFSERLLEQFAPGIPKSEASAKTRKMFETTKGKRIYRLKDGVLPDVEKRTYSRRQARDICERFSKNVDELFSRPQWIGGSESAMFNSLETIACVPHPKTPFLQASLSEAVSPKSDEDSLLLPTRINWVVQSSAVDFLHLMLVCMRWLIDPKIRFCLSFHDEVRYLTPDRHKYQTALALHVTNLLVRSFFVKRLGMNDLPQSVAFFSCVEVDKVYRKDAFVDCVTPSNPHGLSKGYGIPFGESLDISTSIEKAKGKIGVHSIKRKPIMSIATKKKHVIKELVDDDYTLLEGQVLVKVIGVRGNQLYEVKTANDDQFLVSMPKKFRNTIWIKVGSIVVIEYIEEGNKVKGEIVRVFLKDHIKRMKADGKWVSEFDDDGRNDTNPSEDLTAEDSSDE